MKPFLALVLACVALSCAPARELVEIDGEVGEIIDEVEIPFTPIVMVEDEAAAIAAIAAIEATTNQTMEHNWELGPSACPEPTAGTVSKVRCKAYCWLKPYEGYLGMGVDCAHEAGMSTTTTIYNRDIETTQYYVTSNLKDTTFDAQSDAVANCPALNWGNGDATCTRCDARGVPYPVAPSNSLWQVSTCTRVTVRK